MDLVLVVLLVLALGAVVAVALGRVGGGLTPTREDLAPPLDAPVGEPGDLDRARFAVALRGYRMDQVDDVLDQARDLLAERDRELARLRSLLPADPDASTDPPEGPEEHLVQEPVQEPVEQPAEQPR